VQTQVTLTCEICKQQFQRNAAEAKRNASLRRRVFCSRRCVGVSNPPKPPPKGVRQSQLDSANRRDGLSPFRVFIRSAKSRKKLGNLSLADLKELWETQYGRCPYTGWQLRLSRNGTIVPQQASLDRLDCSKPYEKGNVQFVAFIANVAKHTFTDVQLLDFCRAVTLETNRAKLPPPPFI
jgi:hypothetical protein